MDEEPVVMTSAHRHGVPEEDMLHALRHYEHLFDVGEGLMMVIGPDRLGELIEVGVVERFECLYVAHAMRPVRRKFSPYIWR
jgi:hypothetical protein